MTIKGIEKNLFYLILLFLPTQLGRHFWPSFSFVQGIRIDYLSPTIYLTDVLIFLLLVILVVSVFRNPKKLNLKHKILNIKYLLLILFLLAGVIFSKNPPVGIYGLIKLLEFIFLGLYFAKNISFDKKKIGIIASIFALGIIFESSVAILQFIRQSSSGGLLYYFGERFFDGQTPGIANVSLSGHLILRPYGTLPHPNVLAGYLTITMIIVISNLKSQISNLKKTLYLCSILIGTVALLLTMSRVAILLWILILFIRMLQAVYKKNKFTIYYLLLTILIIGTIVVVSPLRLRFTDIKITDESITDRQALVNASVKMIEKKPIFGFGINNYLVELPYFIKSTNRTFVLQPVHNIYLLIASEVGVIGFMFFLWFIKITYQRIMRQKFSIFNFLASLKVWRSGQFSILTMVLIIGFFDHYFLTVQQGQLLIAFVFGYCWVNKNY